MKKESKNPSGNTLDVLQTGVWSMVHWLRFLWPMLLVVGGGWMFFGPAIVNTIESTPHPALVYTIFGACLVAMLSAGMALNQYLLELNLANALLNTKPEERTFVWQACKGRSSFAPVYDLLLGPTRVSANARQTAVAAELEAADHALDARLEFANFLGGALVGLGLVGTFVGLLDTLDDLSKVFSALVNTGGGNVSPTAMFADMVSKLQAPMRGMGTAFVASLYGLLGSLVITLMLVAARKTHAAMNHAVNSVVRRLDYGLRSPQTDASPLQTLLNQITVTNKEQSTAFVQEVDKLGQLMAQQNQAVLGLLQQLADQARNQSSGQGLGHVLAELNAVLRQLQQRFAFSNAHETEHGRAILEQLKLSQKALSQNAAALAVAAQLWTMPEDGAPSSTSSNAPTA
jgi:hypothetical protein